MGTNAKLLFLIFFIFHLILFSQTQIGHDIDGEASFDFLGGATAISKDGSIIAIGVENNDENGENSGQAKVYNNINGEWVQLGSTIFGNEGDAFGNSVSLSSDGTILAVAAIRNLTYNVKVFKYHSNDWVQMGEDFKKQTNDRYNVSIALSLSSNGNRIAIGSPENSDKGSGTGQVRIYEYKDGDWGQLGNNINGKGTSSLLDERFGDAVSLSADGNRISIGAPGTGLAKGRIRAYEYDGLNWNQLGYDFGPNNQGSQAGSSVSMSANGNRIAIGVPGTYSGAAIVYDYTGTQWIVNDSFNIDGAEVSLSGDGNRLAIGDPFNNNSQGLVRIYNYDTFDGNWSQLGIDIIGENKGDLFGRSIALSTDGNSVIVGAIYNDVDELNAQGHVRVFGLNSSSLGIDEMNLRHSFKIYPNPTNEKIYISSKLGDEIEGITLYSITGKLLLKYEEPKKELNLSPFPKGIYFLNIISYSGRITKKIIIE